MEGRAGAAAGGDWLFSESPVRLRSLPGDGFEVESGDEKVRLDPKEPDPGDGGTKTEQEIFRRTNPRPPVGAMLRAQNGAVVELKSKPTDLTTDAWVERLGQWVRTEGPTDELTLNVTSTGITRGELRDLSRLTDELGLDVTINLRADG
jgi:hypothetical protein